MKTPYDRPVDTDAAVCVAVITIKTSWTLYEEDELLFKGKLLLLLLCSFRVSDYVNKNRTSKGSTLKGGHVKGGPGGQELTRVRNSAIVTVLEGL